MAKSTFFWHFGRLLWTGCTYWHYSIKIFLGIFWHKSRVPTRGSWAPNGPCRLKNGSKSLKKWPKLPNFQKNFLWFWFFLNVWVVDTLNLSQDISDKMHNESGQFGVKPNLFFFAKSNSKVNFRKGKWLHPPLLKLWWKYAALIRVDKHQKKIQDRNECKPVN